MSPKFTILYYLALLIFAENLVAAIQVTIVTESTIRSSYTPEDLDEEEPAEIDYFVDYAITPDVDFSGGVVGDTIILDVVAPTGLHFKVTPEGSYVFSTYNRWFEFGKNVGDTGLSNVSFSFLDLSGNVPSANLNTNLIYQGNDASNFLFASFFNSSEAITFSGFRFVATITGDTNTITLPFLESNSFVIRDSNYLGQAAPNDAGILTIVPESNTYALLMAAVSFFFVCLSRGPTRS